MNSAEEVFYSSEALDDSDIGLTLDRLPVGSRYELVQHSLDSNPATYQGTLVELGCGDGRHLRYIQKRYGFENALGFDLRYSKTIEIGQVKFQSANLNHDFPIETGKCDVMMAMMIFEHLFNPWHSFSEVYRCLSPSGRAFINLPLITSVKNRLRLLFGSMPQTSSPYSRWAESGTWDGFHLHSFTLNSIYDLCEKSNLKVERVQPCGSFLHLKSMWIRGLCNEVSFEVSRISKSRFL
jgi:cyclopropane fatty-acyl-phospholipid synthase-like methyltransferase